MKFAKGKSGNPSGRPKSVSNAAKLALDAIAAACTPARMRRMGEKVAEGAADGKIDQIQILLDRLLGKPRQGVDLEVKPPTNIQVTIAGMPVQHDDEELS